jgi:hypothetical protein
MKRLLILSVISIPFTAMAQTSIFNCSAGFTSSGSCSVFIGGGHTFLATQGSLSGSTYIWIPTGATHNGAGFWYQTAVSTGPFSTTFTYIPNGQNLTFLVQNSNVQGGPTALSSGAGCEGGFYQAFGSPPVNNLFALELDSYSNLDSDGNFYGSTAQIYPMNVSPCNPNDSGPNFYLTNKVLMTGVAYNTLAGGSCPGASCYNRGTTTGDTYSTTVINTGTTTIQNTYDVTAGGTCSPPTSSTCSSISWPANIPSIAAGTTGYYGFTTGIGETTTAPLTMVSWTLSTLSAASAPTFSPVAGTYAGTQSVTLSSSSSGAIICYTTLGNNPATNGTAGCAVGTLYTGAISVTSGQTIYAVAGGTNYGDSAVASAAYHIGSTASQPTFYPAAGSYNGTQAVTLSTAQGAVICYSTTTTPATNGTAGCTTGTPYTAPLAVSSNETLKAIAGGTGTTDSLVGSSAYVINPWATGGSNPATNSPTFSPVPGTYTSSQSVSLSSSTSGSYSCYVLSATTPTILPQPDNNGGCIVGTLYSSAIAVSSTQTLYAISSTSSLNLPSSPVQGMFTITGSQATAPSCTPTSGSSSTSITVTCTNSNSGTTLMCYTEDGTSPVTNGSGTGCTHGTSLSGGSNTIIISGATVSTLNVVVGTSTLADSTVSSYGPYTISGATSTVVLTGTINITGTVVLP